MQPIRCKNKTFGGIDLKENNTSIGKWISILHRYAQCYINKQLKEYNIGSGQYPFLAVLLREDGISQEELSCRLHIDKGTTARAIKKLEEEEYIVRKVDEKDKRAYKIYVTEKALKIKPVLFEALKNWTDILVTGFEQKEKEEVIEVLEKMASNAAFYMMNEHQ